MTVAAIVCFVAACVAELAAVALLVWNGRRASRALAQYLAANPLANDDGSLRQITELERTIRVILSNQIERRWAIALVVFGIAAGTAGNFLTL